VIDIGDIQFMAALTCQDQNFSHHIHPTQIDHGVGFRIAFLLGLFDHIMEAVGIVEIVEHKVEAARKDGLYLEDLVAGGDQVLEGIDDRQAGPHIGLKEKRYTVALGKRFELPEIGEIRGTGDLVAGDHGNTVPQEIWIALGDLRIGGVVHKYAVAKVQRYHPLEER